MKCPNECGLTKIIRQYNNKRVSYCESCKMYMYWYTEIKNKDKWIVFKILRQDNWDEGWGRCSRREEVNRVYETRIDCLIGPGGAWPQRKYKNYNLLVRA